MTPVTRNRAFAETNAVVDMMHQVVCGKLVRSEFIVGFSAQWRKQPQEIRTSLSKPCAPKRQGRKDD